MLLRGLPLPRDVRMLILRKLNKFDRAILMDLRGMKVTYPQIPLYDAYMRVKLIMYLPIEVIRNTGLLMRLAELDLPLQLTWVFHRLRFTNIDRYNLLLYVAKLGHIKCVMVILAYMPCVDIRAALSEVIYYGSVEMCQVVYEALPICIRGSLWRDIDKIRLPISIGVFKWCVAMNVITRCNSIALSVCQLCNAEVVAYMNTIWSRMQCGQVI